MPFYEYQCEACGHDSEVMQKISDPPITECPACGKPTLKRLISAPVFRLKGSGWYETDFKSDKDSQRNLAGKPEADAPAEAKKDDKKDEKKADSTPAPAAAEKSAKPAAESASKPAAAPASKPEAKPAKETTSKPAAESKKPASSPNAAS